MLQRLFLSVLLLAVNLGSLSAQNDTAAIDSAGKLSSPPPPFIFKPTIGIGTGMLSYFGDLYQKHLVNPQVSRLGYELQITQEVLPGLRFGFHTMFGKLGANERLGLRNENFESQIRAGGLELEYNFGHLLRTGRNVSPWISAGFESFEFLSKTDLKDRNGLTYYYWSDGSIRSEDENGPLASQAVFLQRDYTYETDIRELNLDGFGKYPERSWAVPVGAGILLHLGDKADAKIGTVFHYSMTDFIDGVSNESSGSRTGTRANDHFLMTSVGVRFNLNFEKKGRDSTRKEDYSDVDYLALDNGDYDQDGVKDVDDSCAGTPTSARVDTKGCPLDEDGDYVPDYRDDEPTSAIGALVDERGVTLTDSIIQLRYEMYMDSTGRFALNEVFPMRGEPYRRAVTPDKVYTVWLGRFTKGLSNEQMTQFLGIEDIRTDPVNDSTTVYSAGQFTDVRSAERRKRILIQQGITIAKVVYKTPSGTYEDVNLFSNDTKGGSDPIVKGSGDNKSGSDPIVKGSGDNKGGTDPIVKGSGDNKGGSDPIVKGSGDNKGGSDPIVKGSGDNKGGSDPIVNGSGDNKGGTDPIVKGSGDTDPSGVVSDKIIFRVQLGAFRRKLSKTVFNDVPELLEFRSDDGLYKYLSGSFATFDEAVARKTAMELKGYSGAFIVAYRKGKRITLTDAGVQTIRPEKNITPADDSASTGPVIGASQVVFKVQVGVFKSEPPSDIQTKMNAAGGIEKTLAPTGLSRYTYGSTSDYTRAQQLRDEIKAKGFPDAFIIAFLNGEYIPVADALELLRKSDGK